MGKYKQKNDRKRNPIYYYAQKAQKCNCTDPNPTGEWSVRGGKSYATCKCGKEYETALLEKTFKS